MSNRTLTTPQELADFLTGKELYNDGFNMSACKSAAQQQGWQSAQQHQYVAILERRGSTINDGFATVYKRNGLDIYRDNYAGWMTVEEDGATVLDTRPHFSEAAFKEVAYNNEYSFNGVDYNEPSVQ